MTNSASSTARGSSWYKATAVTTAIAFLYTGVLFQPLFAIVDLAHETQEIRAVVRKASFSIVPANAGTISGGSYTGGRSLVVCIQDLHCNPTVQKNICDIISAIDRQCGVQRIMVEGAPTGKFDLGILGIMPNPAAKKSFVATMMKRGVLTGVEYYALLNGEEKIVGLEDWNLYRQNFQRARALTLHKEDNLRQVDAISAAVSAAKKIYLSRQVARLERRLGEPGSKRWFRMINQRDEKWNENVRWYPNIDRSITIAQLKKHLSYRRAAIEQKQYLEELRKTIPFEEYNSRFNAGNSGGEVFYAQLAETARRYTPALALRRPHLATLLQYVSLNQEINPIELYQEARLYTDRLIDRIAQSPRDREIVFLERMTLSLRDLANLKITPQELESFQSGADRYRVLLAKYAGDNVAMEAALLLNEKTLNDYYSVNLDRNAVFVDSIAQAVTPTRASASPVAVGPAVEVIGHIADFTDVSIVVTGGFHSSIAASLQNKNISTLIITPAVTTGGNSEDVYDKMLTGTIAGASGQSAFVIALSHALSAGNYTLFESTIREQIAAIEQTSPSGPERDRAIKEFLTAVQEKLHDSVTSIRLSNQEGGTGIEVTYAGAAVHESEPVPPLPLYTLFDLSSLMDTAYKSPYVISIDMTAFNLLEKNAAFISRLKSLKESGAIIVINTTGNAALTEKDPVYILHRELFDGVVSAPPRSGLTKGAALYRWLIARRAFLPPVIVHIDDEVQVTAYDNTFESRALPSVSTDDGAIADPGFGHGHADSFSIFNRYAVQSSVLNVTAEDRDQLLARFDLELALLSARAVLVPLKQEKLLNKWGQLSPEEQANLLKAIAQEHDPVYLDVLARRYFPSKEESDRFLYSFRRGFDHLFTSDEKGRKAALGLVIELLQQADVNRRNGIGIKNGLSSCCSTYIEEHKSSLKPMYLNYAVDSPNEIAQLFSAMLKKPLFPTVSEVAPDLKYIRIIGAGGNGLVYEVEDKGVRKALKVLQGLGNINGAGAILLRTKAKQKEAISKERTIMRELSGISGIIQVDPVDCDYGILMELVSGPDVANGAMTIPPAQFWEKLESAVVEISKRGYVIDDLQVMIDNKGDPFIYDLSLYEKENPDAAAYANENIVAKFRGSVETRVRVRQEKAAATGKSGDVRPASIADPIMKRALGAHPWWYAVYTGIAAPVWEELAFNLPYTLALVTGNVPIILAAMLVRAIVFSASHVIVQWIAENKFREKSISEILVYVWQHKKSFLSAAVPSFALSVVFSLVSWSCFVFPMRIPLSFGNPAAAAQIGATVAHMVFDVPLVIGGFIRANFGINPAIANAPPDDQSSRLSSWDTWQGDMMEQNAFPQPVNFSVQEKKYAAAHQPSDNVIQALIKTETGKIMLANKLIQDSQRYAAPLADMNAFLARLRSDDPARQAHLVLFDPDSAFKKELTNRYHVRDVVIVDPYSKTIYIDAGFWESSVTNLVKNQPSSYTMALNVMALLCYAEQTLRAVESLENNSALRRPSLSEQPLSRTEESAIRRQVDASVMTWNGMALDAAVSSYLENMNLRQEGLWFVNAIRTRAPPIKRFIYGLFQYPGWRRIMATQNLLTSILDAYNRRAFDRLPIHELCLRLSAIAGNLNNGTAPHLTAPLMTDLEKTHMQLLAVAEAMKDCLYLRTIAGKNPLGHSGTARQIIMEDTSDIEDMGTIDIVSLSKLITNIEDILDGTYSVHDIEELRIRVNESVKALTVVDETLIESFDQSHQELHDIGLIINKAGKFSGDFRAAIAQKLHQESIDNAAADKFVEQFPGEYQTIREQLQKGNDVLIVVWAMGGGADVASGYRRWQELKSLESKVRREQRALNGSCGKIHVEILSSGEKRIGTADPVLNPEKYVNEQRPLYVKKNGRYEKIVPGVIQREDIGDAIVGPIHPATPTMQLTGAPKRLDEGFVVEGIQRQARLAVAASGNKFLKDYARAGGDSAHLESLTQQISNLKTLSTEMTMLEKNIALERVAVKHMHAVSPTTLGELQERYRIAQRGSLNLLQSLDTMIDEEAARARTQNAVNRQDILDNFSTMVSAGVIPYSMVTIDGTVEETAQALTAHIAAAGVQRKERTGGREQFVLFELYEHGGDAVAGMHARNRKQIVSPANEKFCMMVARRIVQESDPSRFQTFFTLSGLGNDFESHPLWMNEIFKFLLNNGIIKDILPPWAEGTIAGATIALAIAAQVESYANKRGLGQLSAKTWMNTLYRFGAFLDRNPWAGRALERVLKENVFGSRSIFAAIIGYVGVGPVTRRQDFHGGVAYSNSGELPKYTFSMPFELAAMGLDVREAGTFTRLGKRFLTDEQLHEHIGKLMLDAVEPSVTMETIEREYETFGIKTEKGSQDRSHLPAIIDPLPAAMWENRLRDAVAVELTKVSPALSTDEARMVVSELKFSLLGQSSHFLRDDQLMKFTAERVLSDRMNAWFARRSEDMSYRIDYATAEGTNAWMYRLLLGLFQLLRRATLVLTGIMREKITVAVSPQNLSEFISEGSSIFVNRVAEILVVKQGHMRQAIEEGLRGQDEHRGILTPHVGAVLVCEGLEGYGYNLAGNRLHGEYFAVIDLLRKIIDYRLASGAIGQAMMLDMHRTLNRVERISREFNNAENSIDVFGTADTLLLKVSRKLGYPLRRSQLYVTMAPCNHCKGLIEKLEIQGVNYGATVVNDQDTDGQHSRFQRIRLMGGILTLSVEPLLQWYRVAIHIPGYDYLQRVYRNHSAHSYTGDINNTTRSMLLTIVRSDPALGVDKVKYLEELLNNADISVVDSLDKTAAAFMINNPTTSDGAMKISLFLSSHRYAALRRRQPDPLTILQLAKIVKDPRILPRDRPLTVQEALAFIERGELTPKLVATDIDGTLLIKNGRMSQKNLAALALVLRADIPVVLVSANIFDNARKNVIDPLMLYEMRQRVRALTKADMAKLKRSSIRDLSVPAESTNDAVARLKAIVMNEDFSIYNIKDPLLRTMIADIRIKLCPLLHAFCSNGAQRWSYSIGTQKGNENHSYVLDKDDFNGAMKTQVKKIARTVWAEVIAEQEQWRASGIGGEEFHQGSPSDYPFDYTVLSTAMSSEKTGILHDPLRLEFEPGKIRMYVHKELSPLIPAYYARLNEALAAEGIAYIFNFDPSHPNSPWSSMSKDQQDRVLQENRAYFQNCDNLIYCAPFDKSYAISLAADLFAAAPSEILYLGDRMAQGQDDAAVLVTGVNAVEITDPEQSGKIMLAIAKRHAEGVDANNTAILFSEGYKYVKSFLHAGALALRLVRFARKDRSYIGEKHPALSGAWSVRSANGSLSSVVKEAIFERARLGQQTLLLQKLSDRPEGKKNLVWVGTVEIPVPDPDGGKPVPLMVKVFGEQVVVGTTNPVRVPVMYLEISHYQPLADHEFAPDRKRIVALLNHPLRDQLILDNAGRILVKELNGCILDPSYNNGIAAMGLGSFKPVFLEEQGKMYWIKVAADDVFALEFQLLNILPEKSSRWDLLKVYFDALAAEIAQLSPSLQHTRTARREETGKEDATCVVETDISALGNGRVGSMGDLVKSTDESPVRLSLSVRGTLPWQLPGESPSLIDPVYIDWESACRDANIDGTAVVFREQFSRLRQLAVRENGSFSRETIERLRIDELRLARELYQSMSGPRKRLIKLYENEDIVFNRRVKRRLAELETIFPGEKIGPAFSRFIEMTIAQQARVAAASGDRALWLNIPYVPVSEKFTLEKEKEYFEDINWWSGIFRGLIIDARVIGDGDADSLRRFCAGVQLDAGISARTAVRVALDSSRWTDHARVAAALAPLNMTVIWSISQDESMIGTLTGQIISVDARNLPGRDTVTVQDAVQRLMAGGARQVHVVVCAETNAKIWGGNEDLNIQQLAAALSPAAIQSTVVKSIDSALQENIALFLSAA